MALLARISEAIYKIMTAKGRIISVEKMSLNNLEKLYPTLQFLHISRRKSIYDKMGLVAKKNGEIKKEQERKFHHELMSQMLTLATSGFGLVAALAWNEAIQTFVKEYIQRFYPNGAGVISKFLYAIIITAFAVFITYQLSKLRSRVEDGK